MIETLPSLADFRCPSGFPAFVADQVQQGTDIRDLLESPQKWEIEFAQFLAGVNCDVIRRGQPIADWLNDNTYAWEVRSTGGSAERPLNFRDIEFGPGNTGKRENLVGDFSDYDASLHDQPKPVTGAKYRFTLKLPSACGSLPERVECEATAFPEVRHGRSIVVFELEAKR